MLDGAAAAAGSKGGGAVVSAYILITTEVAKAMAWPRSAPGSRAC
jgi:hypothetical protein